MSQADAIALYGTDEPVTPPTLLRAGPLTAELDAGNLRHIKVGGVEVLRAISFIVRDKGWGTYSPTIADLHVEQEDGRFAVRYRAEVVDGAQAFRYHAVIEGSPDCVSFAADGEAATDFETCRTGFVVLHPVNGVAGAPVTVEHVDGRVVESRFPDLIDPIQPMMDLRALTHEAAPGLTVTCRMDGDTFEMEDQRNWGDASYKTYVRPLSRPWPYTLAAGEALHQAVTLEVSGNTASEESGAAPIRAALGDVIGPAPALGLGFDPDEAGPTRRVLPKLADLSPKILVCHCDPRRGHDRAALEAAVGIARDLGAEPWLEAVIADVPGFETEIAALGETVRALGSPFAAVLLSPAPDLKSTTPGQPWPDAPPPEAFFRAARRAFRNVRLGGGMISTFTELNRKRPPLEHLDYVGFSTVALIHASDDTSVIEGLESLPSIVRSAKAIAKHLPVVVGPSAIGLRQNPYGTTPVPNPGNKRQAMARNDPRQRGQLGAAWVLGYYAHAARAGADAIVFGGTTGPLGVVHTPQPWPTPGYTEEGTPYPVFHALQALARHDSHQLRDVAISDPARVQGIAFEQDRTVELILVNLTAATHTVEIEGRWHDPAGSSSEPTASQSSAIVLPGYWFAKLTGPIPAKSRDSVETP